MELHLADVQVLLQGLINRLGEEEEAIPIALGQRLGKVRVVRPVHRQGHGAGLQEAKVNLQVVFQRYRLCTDEALADVVAFSQQEANEEEGEEGEENQQWQEDPA